MCVHSTNISISAYTCLCAFYLWLPRKIHLNICQTDRQTQTDRHAFRQWRSLRFFTISSLRREPSPTRTLKWPRRNLVQITCNTSSAHHVQHVVCYFVRRDSSAIKFDRVKIEFISALSYCLKPLIDDGHRSGIRRRRRRGRKNPFGDYGVRTHNPNCRPLSFGSASVQV